MDIIKTILILFAAFVESFILYRIMATVLQPKHKVIPIAVSSTQFFLMIIKQILTVSPELLKYQAIVSIILLAYIYLCIHIFMKNSLVEKIIWFIIYFFGLFVVELITMLFLSLIMKHSIKTVTSMDQLSLLVVALGKVVTYLLFELMITKRKGKLIIGISYFRELVIICFFNIILLVGVIYVCYNKQGVVQQIDNVVTGVLLLVFVITAYTVALIFRIEKKSNVELDTQLKLQQIKMELELNNNIVDMTDKLRKLRHDMNNHLGIIKVLVKTQNHTDLEEYINQIYEDVEIANEIVITSNKTLSILLSTKKSLAKQRNIDFTSVIAAQEINMQNKDICSLLGNILDNAIEASANCSNKKYIQLMIQNTQEGCIIKCENSFGLQPIMKKGRFLTKKENTYMHGIGTENIKEIVTKYNVKINFDYDEEIFNIRVVIPA